jgi:hypothetical protein
VKRESKVEEGTNRIIRRLLGTIFFGVRQVGAGRTVVISILELSINSTGVDRRDGYRERVAGAAFFFGLGVGIAGVEVD